MPGSSTTGGGPAALYGSPSRQAALRRRGVAPRGARLPQCGPWNPNECPAASKQEDGRGRQRLGFGPIALKNGVDGEKSWECD